MITVGLKGRLGNQMFQYATTRSVAEKNGFNFYVDECQWLGGQLFDINFGVLDGKPQFIYRESVDGYDENMWNVLDFTVLDGYFQGEIYFDVNSAKEWFKLKPNICADNIISKYPLNEYCYINLRGTDYKGNYWVLPLEYYNRAIELIKTTNPDIKFLVITDDIVLGLEYFPHYPMIRNTTETDFNLLNRAKNIIIANSSFAWWAAWLGVDNNVIAPNGWLNVTNNSVFTANHQYLKSNKFKWI